MTSIKAKTFIFIIQLLNSNIRLNSQVKYKVKYKFGLISLVTKPLSQLFNCCVTGQKILDINSMNINNMIIVILIYFIGNEIANVMLQVCLGKTFGINDEKFLTIMKSVQNIVLAFDGKELLNVFPWLKYFPDTKNIKAMREGVKSRDELLIKEFDEHRRTLDPLNIRDLADNLIHLSQNKEIWQDAGFEEVTEDDLHMVIYSLMLAGIETTLSTTLWFFVYMLHYPEYQNKMFEEIQSKVGLDRPVVYKDMESLPFVQAVILETHRMGSVIPLLPHLYLIKPLKILG